MQGVKRLSEKPLQIAEQRDVKKQGKKGKIHPIESKIPQNSKERSEGLLKWATQRNRGKQQNGKDQRSLHENWSYQGNTSCKDGHNKRQNGKDLTEAGEVKERWQEYIEKLQKKGLNDSDNHDGVVTDIQPDSREYEVKWPLEALL